MFIMFEFQYEKILEKIDNFDPRNYKKTRNFLDGNVSLLSPYITAGVITQRYIVQRLLERFDILELKDFIFELAWREFFYSVWEAKGDRIFEALRNPQEGILGEGLPKVVLDANTGIKALDTEISRLIESGYMHNHARMWTASVVCNFAKSWWLDGAKWMYYHLLDGDLASNTLSWQWVCGAFSSKEYWFNQDNVNKYAGFEQKGTFADRPYKDFPLEYVPKILNEKEVLDLKTEYPELDQDYKFEFNEQKLSVKIESIESLQLNDSRVYMVHPWDFDIALINDFEGEKVLVIDRSFFEQFAISKKRLDFYFALSTNIPGIKICICDFADFYEKFEDKYLFYTNHPMVRHWKGESNNVIKMFPSLKGREFKSFFGFWKKAEKNINNLILENE